MKAPPASKSTSSKPRVKMKALVPRKDPKGGGKSRPPGGDCDEFGCGGNHNEVLIQGAVR